MPQDQNEGRGGDGTQDGTETGAEQAPPETAMSRWFASTALRTGLAAIGLVVMLFALGQAVGLPLLELTVEAVTSQIGRWLVVALFGLLLVAVARRGWPSSA